jgi:Peptidase family M23
VTPTTSAIDADIRPATRVARVRPWIALAAAAVLFALVVFGFWPFTFAAPVIGMVLALGSPPDYVGQARPVARRPRNAVVGVAIIAALAVVVWQPQLTLPLVVLFGMDGSGLVVTVVAVIALALPLAMTDATSDELPAGWFLLTRRNLILSLTILVSVATWYGTLGHSFIPLAVFVLGLPLLIGCSRIVAARKGRLEYGLLREPLRPGLGPHRLQLINVVLFCGLAALTVSTGAYAAIAIQLPGIYRVLLMLFFASLVAFVLLALLPLRRIRLGSNALVVAGTIFLAMQLILLYRPPVDAVIIGSPLGEEWWVGHGGRAELINYHHTGSMQRNAVDIMRVGDGGIHRPGGTDLADYYVYGQPVLAPADGTVTYVLDGRPDQPIGSVDERYPSGNQLVMDIGSGRYLMMGHLRQGSINVAVGDRVNVGQQIARVGNSGNTSAPHIHIQAQTLPTALGDIKTVDLPQILTTLRTYPLLFRDASLIRDGVETWPSAVDPRRGDVIRPTK